MKLKLADRYIGKSQPFPSDDTPQMQKRDKQYFIDCANAIIAKQVNNRCTIPYDYKATGYRPLSELKAYYTGVNSPEKYKDYIVGPPGKDGLRKTTMNISWDTIKFVATKLGTIKGYMQKIPFDIKTAAIDPTAMKEKKMAVSLLKLRMDERTKMFGQQLNEAAGAEIVKPTPVGVSDGIPFRRKEDVDAFAATGGIILAQEEAIEKLLEKSYYESGSDIVSDMNIDDLIAYGIAGKKVFCNAGSVVPLERHVNMENAILPFSEYPDFRDATFGGEIRPMTIRQLRSESNLSDKEVMEIARSYSRAGDSGGFGSNFYGMYQNALNGDISAQNVIDALIVDVADVCWIGTETDKVTKVKRKVEKNIAINRVKDDYELTESQRQKGKELKTYTKQCVYKAKLIVGTNFVFDYGKEYNITYTKDQQGRYRALLPYRFVKTGTVSLTEACISFIDDINMAVYRKRNAIAKLPPLPGIEIDQASLRGVKINGKEKSPMELMKLYQNEGFLITNTADAWGNMQKQGGAVRIIPNQIFDYVQAMDMEVEKGYANIERVTSINSIFSGQTPGAETAVGVAKIAIDATVNSMHPLVKAYKTLTENTARVIAYKWQVSSQFMDDAKREMPAGSNSLQYIKIGKELAFSQFDIKFEIGTSDEDRQMLLQEITNLRDYRRQAGSGGIRPSDYLLLYQMIKEGNIRQAQLALAQIEEFLAEEDKREAQERYQENAELQRQSNEQAIQGKMTEIQTAEQLKTEREMGLKQVDNNIELQRMQHELMLEEIRHRNAMKEKAADNIYGIKKEAPTKK